jgi:carbon-monoxide dehydrogenase medium subunit
MKSADFSYQRATSPEEALHLYGQAGGEARYLAGGQSLMAALNFRLDAPEVLIDISRLRQLSGICEIENGVQVGATTRHADVAKSGIVAARLPLITRAMAEVAHPAIRSRGTFGGSIALADPAAEMPACALALGAKMYVLGEKGPRAVAADDWCLGTYETALEPGDLLTHVELPAQAAGTKWGFAELARRRGDYAMAGLAVVVGDAPRIVYFGVSDRPVRAAAAEAALGRGAAAADVAALADEGLDVFGDLNASEPVKRRYMQVLLARVLNDLQEVA